MLQGLDERPQREKSTKDQLNDSKDFKTEHDKLLNPDYLKDKSIKKVSIATLKRRMMQQK